MRVLAPGELVGSLTMPRLDLEVAILEGTEWATLRRGAGHIPGTPLPGQPGNVGIAAHRDSYFRPLQDVRVGDSIEIATPGATYAYVVERTEIVEPHDVEVLHEGEGRDLTLVTCYPFYLVGNAPQRFIVHARLVHDPAVSGPGRN